MQIALPGRCGVAPISGIKRHQADAIARSQARWVTKYRDEFGIKSDVHTMGMIEKFEIGQQRRLGKHVLDEQRLAPTAVSNNQVGPKAIVAQPAADLGDRRPRVDSAVKLHGVGMAVDRASLVLR